MNIAEPVEFYKECSITRKNFVQKNNNGSTQKFWQHPDVPILDGYTVVIRQVSILTGPIAQGFAENIIA